MAGLIAGRDATLTAPYATAPATAYRGIAPDARVVNLKVGVADGGVDVTQVIAAIDWVVQHKNDPGMNIRVLNVSYGTNSLQAPGVDPLSFAVEQAWKAGIVVVAAAGNSGYQDGADAPGLANPATTRSSSGSPARTRWARRAWPTTRSAATRPSPTATAAGSGMAGGTWNGSTWAGSSWAGGTWS